MLLNFYIHTIDCILESFMIKSSFASPDGVSVGMDVFTVVLPHMLNDVGDCGVREITVSRECRMYFRLF